MAVTETTTKTISLTTDVDGKVLTMHGQTITVYTDEDGGVINRVAGPATPLDATDLAAMLAADDRARLAAALA